MALLIWYGDLGVCPWGLWRIGGVCCPFFPLRFWGVYTSLSPFLGFPRGVSFSTFGGCVSTLGLSLRVNRGPGKGEKRGRNFWRGNFWDCVTTLVGREKYFIKRGGDLILKEVFLGRWLGTYS